MMGMFRRFGCSAGRQIVTPLRGPWIGGRAVRYYASSGDYPPAAKPPTPSDIVVIRDIFALVTLFGAFYWLYDLRKKYIEDSIPLSESPSHRTEHVSAEAFSDEKSDPK